MPVCDTCGVELQENAAYCPLCRAPVEPDRPISLEEGRKPYPDRAVDPEHLDTLSGSDKRKIFLEIFAVCSGIASVTLLAIELLVDGRVSWSLFPIASVVYLNALVAAPMTLRGRPRLTALAITAATTVFVLCIDILDGGRAWFASIGAPITLSVAASAGAGIEIIARSRRKGVNAISVSLLAIAAACVGIEATLDAALRGAVLLQWSSVVAFTCVPVAGLLLYIHYRLADRASLKKLFHL
jgi:hypothetical protein